MNISLAQKHFEQALEFERQLIEIAIDVNADVQPLIDMRLAGDPFLLRGIPTVGVRGGLGGAIRGTSPHTMDLK